jgi:hypothetical protein
MSEVKPNSSSGVLRSFIREPDSGAIEEFEELVDEVDEALETGSEPSSGEPVIEVSYDGESLSVNPYSSKNPANLDEFAESSDFRAGYNVKPDDSIAPAAKSKDGNRIEVHGELYSALEAPLYTTDSNDLDGSYQGDFRELIENGKVLLSTENDLGNLITTSNVLGSYNPKISPLFWGEDDEEWLEDPSEADYEGGPIAEAKMDEDRIIVGPMGPDIELNQEYSEERVTMGDSQFTVEIHPTYDSAHESKYTVE